MILNINDYLLDGYQNYIPTLSNKAAIDIAALNFTCLEDYLITSKGGRRTLLSTSSKYSLSHEYGYINTGLYLDPFASKDICPNKGACARTCLTFTGRMPLSKDKRRLLTAAFIKYPVEFLQRLIVELQQIILDGYLQDKKIAFRFNGTSDIKIEKILNIDRLSAALNYRVSFYDYTKLDLSTRNPSEHYHLTYSIDERLNIKEGKKYLCAGYCVAIVMKKKDVNKLVDNDSFIDGDRHDLRFLDSGIVLLKAKNLIGKKYSDTGIVLSMDQVESIIGGGHE